MTSVFYSYKRFRNVTSFDRVDFLRTWKFIFTMVKIVLRENGNFETKPVFKWFRCRRACFFRKQNKTDFQLITVWNCFFLFWQKHYYYFFINLNINSFQINNNHHSRRKLKIKFCYLRKNKERLAFFEKQALLIEYALFRYTTVTSIHHFATNAVYAPKNASLRKKAWFRQKKCVYIQSNAYFRSDVFWRCDVQWRSDVSKCCRCGEVTRFFLKMAFTAKIKYCQSEINFERIFIFKQTLCVFLEKFIIENIV